MGKIKDLTGKQFGRLTVIKQADDRISPSNKRIIRWLCQCECGNFKIIDGANSNLFSPYLHKYPIGIGFVYGTKPIKAVSRFCENGTL